MILNKGFIGNSIYDSLTLNVIYFLFETHSLIDVKV